MYSSPLIDQSMLSNQAKAKQRQRMIQLGVNLTTLDASDDFIAKKLLIRHQSEQMSRAAIAMLRNTSETLPTPTVEAVANKGYEWQFLHDEHEILVDNAVAIRQHSLAAALSHGINLIEQRCHLPARRDT